MNQTSARRGDETKAGASGGAVAPADTRKLGNPAFDIVAISVLLLAASAALVVLTPHFLSVTRHAGWWMFPAICVAYAATEVSVFRFTFRREAIAFSLSEIPLAFSLVYLTPVPGLLARVVGSVAVILLLRRAPVHKLIFNVALFTFELALAYLIFRGLLGWWGDGDAPVVIAAITATALSGTVSSILVSVAISRYEGDLLRRIGSELRLAWWLFVVNSTLAGMVLGLVLVSPGLVLLALVPIGLLWYVIKAYGAVDQRLRDLDDLHGFTGRVGQSLDPEEIGQAAVGDAATLLRSQGAALVLYDVGGAPMVMTDGRIDVTLPDGPADPAWAAYVASTTVQLIDGVRLDPLRSERFGSLGEIMVAPMRDVTGPIGLLVVAGRGGAGKRFGDADIARLRNLTEQLTASLRRGMLHQRIEREARHDGLTGLPNRTSLERSLDDAIAQRPVDGCSFVMMIDLDRFKEVNDTLGHHAGDELLIEVAHRMQSQVTSEDVLARLASDEFVVLGHRADDDAVLEFAQRSVRELGRPVTLDGLELVVTASAGVAVLGDETDVTSALRHADIAMYSAKTQRLGVDVYREEIDRRTPSRLSMLGDLRSAIEEQQLHVNFQPKLDLATGTVVGAEALVRWTHPGRGMVSPEQFVRVAEDTGLIKQLTDLMLGEGICAMRRVHDRGYHLGLSVNLSTHDLLDTRLAERVDAHLAANGVDPSMLTLEITESSLLIDAPRANSTIDDLNDIGVRMSIDDFGTGYSSLSYLRRLPVAELKIDRSFVANVLIDEQDEVIVRSTIDLGHNLGLEVVAEGVENNEILERLRQLGCDVAQGFCISRPLSTDHFLSWLATTSHPSRLRDPLDPNEWHPITPAPAKSDTRPSTRPDTRPSTRPSTPGNA